MSINGKVGDQDQDDPRVRRGCQEAMSQDPLTYTRAEVKKAVQKARREQLRRTAGSPPPGKTSRSDKKS